MTTGQWIFALVGIAVFGSGHSAIAQTRAQSLTISPAPIMSRWEKQVTAEEPLRRSKGKEQFELELGRMMNQLHSHPSIVTWVVHNEGWGKYDNERLSAWVKGLDSSRVVKAVSGWNDRGASDFYDIHTYE